MDDAAISTATAIKAKEAATPTLKQCGVKGKTRKAIEAMAQEGLSLPLAAKKFDIRRRNLARSFDKPHVRSAYNQLVAEIRDNAAQAAWLRINHMGQTAQSEQVKFRANKWVAGVDGVSEVKRVQGQHHHAVTFAGFDYDDDPADSSPVEDHTSPIIEGEASEIID